MKSTNHINLLLLSIICYCAAFIGSVISWFPLLLTISGHPLAPGHLKKLWLKNIWLPSCCSDRKADPQWSHVKWKQNTSYHTIKVKQHKLAVKMKIINLIPIQPQFNYLTNNKLDIRAILWQITRKRCTLQTVFTSNVLTISEVQGYHLSGCRPACMLHGIIRPSLWTSLNIVERLFWQVTQLPALWGDTRWTPKVVPPG